jgi:imidazole glycerol phosphate synthase glutamine amidotransferase subunit
MQVIVVATGAANLASVRAAFARLGADVHVSRDPRAIQDADHVVLPGVGSFAAARQALVASGAWEAVAARLQRGQPTLAVCLGLQLLCEGSDEAPEEDGFAILPGRARRFSTDLTVPQLGWNRVEPEPGSVYLTPGYAYFANTYRLAEHPSGWTTSLSDYGGQFVAAAERGALLACQFHPELSGPWGAQVLERWWTTSRGRAC